MKDSHFPMTETEIETEMERLRAKFAVLRKVAQARAELVQFLDFNEKNLLHVFANISPTKTVFRSANSELRVWVRAFLKGDQQRSALAQLAALDPDTGTKKKL